MAKFVVHYADIEFEVEGSSAMEILGENPWEGAVVEFPNTNRGAVAIVLGGGIPVYVTEKPDGRSWAF